MIEELEALEPFREEVRQWCATHIPKNWRTEQAGADHHQFATFHRWWGSQLRDAGYFAPHWPVEWGGGGFSLLQQVVLGEEFARADAPRNGLYQVALYNAGPSILHAGTDEQKRRFLPGIINGTVWCQGFSEPNAGSDLAGLQTRAIRDGDHYVVTGQKVWTSLAMEAQHCILLVRTDPTAKKHKGITYLLMDMDSPGIEVRPIRQATGQSEFCETFLDEVRIPVENRLGAENEGWGVTQATLASERGAVLIELAERLRRNGTLALAEAAKVWKNDEGGSQADDPAVQEIIGARYAESMALRQLLNTMVTNVIRRGGVGPEASVVKLFYSELLQQVMKDAVSIGGPAAQNAQPSLMSAGWESGVWLYDYINAFGWTIGGGTSEIMRNIIGERVLGLPRDPEPKGA
ncbi:MAG: acyl-CoA dehydrogenase family protein [Actinomycetota bacterium]|nr:acyl-CoA dehydrogenase family protein [Actinomycetota bacterium]